MSAPRETRYAKVIGTAKFRDKIFSFVEPVQLFSLQRVCKQWRTIIRNYWYLQRDLCFIDPSKDENHSPFKWNPFLLKYGTIGSGNCSGGFCMTITTEALKRLNHPTASWREMLIGTPKAPEIHLVGAEGLASINKVNYNKGGLGVRMDRIADFDWAANQKEIRKIFEEHHLPPRTGYPRLLGSIHIRVRGLDPNPEWGVCGYTS